MKSSMWKSSIDYRVPSVWFIEKFPFATSQPLDKWLRVLESACVFLFFFSGNILEHEDNEQCVPSIWNHALEGTVKKIFCICTLCVCGLWRGLLSLGLELGSYSNGNLENNMAERQNSKSNQLDLIYDRETPPQKWTGDINWGFKLI